MSYYSRRRADTGQRPLMTTPPQGVRESKPTRALLDTPRAAKMLGMSSRTLEKWRGLGTGPPYLKLGRRVLYSTTELETWLKSRRRQSTSEL